MAKILKSSSKKTNTKTKKPAATVKKSIIVEKKIKGPIKISKTYIPKDTEKYMGEKHLIFFKLKLLSKKPWLH